VKTEFGLVEQEMPAKRLTPLLTEASRFPVDRTTVYADHPIMIVWLKNEYPANPPGNAPQFTTQSIPPNLGASPPIPKEPKFSSKKEVSSQVAIWTPL